MDAEKLAQDHGKAAASWTIDGNTSQQTIRKIVKMFDDGDPEIYDWFVEPNFSGEYADAYSERDLCDDLGIDYDLTDTVEVDEIVDSYLDMARSAFWEEVERLYRIAGTFPPESVLYNTERTTNGQVLR